MAIFRNLTDQHLHIIARRINSRITHWPAYDAATCSQCRVFWRVIDELRSRQNRAQSRGWMMKTMRRLSSRWLDKLQERIADRLQIEKQPPKRRVLLCRQDRILKERLRRLGLS